jgi:hypothetical protein
MNKFSWFAAVLALALACTPRALAQDAAEHPASKPRGARIAASWAGSTAGMGLAYGAAILAARAVHSGCAREVEDEEDGFDELGCELDTALAGVAVGLALTPAATTVGSYLPHRFMGGKGPWWTAGLGSLLGMGVALSGAVIPDSLDASLPVRRAVFAGVSVLAAGVPVLFLEISHGRRSHGERAEARPARSLAVGLTNLDRGLLLGVKGRL